MTALDASAERDLRAYCDDTSGVFVEQGASSHVSRWFPMTEEFGWTLMLFHQRGEQFLAVCNGAGERKATGSLASCREWLAARAQEARRLTAVIGQVREFGTGRPGWTYREQGCGSRPVARRVFEFPEVEEKVAVMVYPDPTYPVGRFSPVMAEVQLPFSAGPQDSFSGDMDVVTQWVAGYEKCLSLPARLRAAGDRDEAQALADTAPIMHIQRLGYLLDMGNALLSSGVPRRRLVETFAAR